MIFLFLCEGLWLDVRWLGWEVAVSAEHVEVGLSYKHYFFFHLFHCTSVECLWLFGDHKI